MIYFKLYDRKDLSVVDSGFVRDYNIDYDYLTNNSSSVSIIRTCKGYNGNLISLSEGTRLILLGAVTAVDNSDLKITFKHLKEIFNDKILNVFKYTNLLNKKFEAVQGLKTLIEFGYINTSDAEKRIPLLIQILGSEPNAVWNDDSDTIDMISFIDYLFDHYGIYIDFDIDFGSNKLICKIINNTKEPVILKDNIKLSKPELDNAELPKENKAVFFNKDNGVIIATYYLLQDNSITTDSENINRLFPPMTKYVNWDPIEATKEGYSIEDLARSELCGNIYNHCIIYKLAKRQTMIDVTKFRYGDKVKIIYKNREYNSIFTGIKFKMGDPFYSCIFGKTRIDFTDRMKMYNNYKFEKRRR